MSNKLLLGLINDESLPEPIKTALESLVAALQVWQRNVPPNDAEFIVGTASDDLSNERVVTNSNTIRFDRSTTGQLRAHAVGASGGGGYLLSLGAIESAAETHVPALVSRPHFGSTGTTSSSSGSSADFVVLSDGGNPPYPMFDANGNFLYIEYTA